MLKFIKLTSSGGKPATINLAHIAYIGPPRKQGACNVALSLPGESIDVQEAQYDIEAAIHDGMDNPEVKIITVKKKSQTT